MIANLRWHEALRDAGRRGEPAVLVSVGTASGSTPREAGASMVVTAQALAGTIGGGHLEFEALRMAREALATAAPPATWAVRFPLAARLGQCCGGVATLVFASVEPLARGWLDIVADCLRAATPCAVVSRLGAGAARIVVTLDDARGTLGEPALDSAAIGAARARLAHAAGGSGLAEAPGATLFVHVVRPTAFHVRVFGNGHVGRALVHVLGALPLDVAWVDSRDHDFPATVPDNCEVVATDDPTAEVASAPRGAYVVVMTHSHALDFDIVEAALARDDFRYIGLIGSKAKRAQFERRLAQRGLSSAVLARVTCPIGAALRGKEPGIIAVGVASELLALRDVDAAGWEADRGGRAAAPIGARMRAMRPRPEPEPTP